MTLEEALQEEEPDNTRVLEVPSTLLSGSQRPYGIAIVQQCLLKLDIIPVRRRSRNRGKGPRMDGVFVLDNDTIKEIPIKPGKSNLYIQRKVEEHSKGEKNETTHSSLATPADPLL